MYRQIEVKEPDKIAQILTEQAEQGFYFIAWIPSGNYHCVGWLILEQR